MSPRFFGLCSCELLHKPALGGSGGEECPQSSRVLFGCQAGTEKREIGIDLPQVQEKVQSKRK